MTDYLDRTIDINDPRIAASLDEVSMWASRFGVLILDSLELRRDIDALDLACGTGFPLFELAHMHGRSCRFVGVDIWKPALARAAFKLSVYADPHVSLARADGARLPFANESFDLITCNVGVNNFADFNSALAECARTLRLGGRIALTSNITGNMAEFYDVFREVLREMGHADRIAALDAQEAHRLNPDVIGGMLESAGIEVTRRIVQPFAMRFVDSAAMLRHWLIVIGFLDGWRGVLDAQIERDVFARVERRLNEIAADAGELRMTIPKLYIEGRRI